MYIEAKLADKNLLELLPEALDNIRRLAADRELGGIEIFIGVVKGVVNGSRVIKLVYTAYTRLAEERLKKIAEEEALKHRLHAAVIIHRIGEVKPGEATVVILAAGKSREDVNKATKSMIDRVKREAPIYKLEVREDGEYWVLGDETRVRRVSS
ncbi:molybdenum cofactor biosynthesis protein MoaE [Thermogladius sp. 4427co]|uniref:molybdenum cofactor biosynthesis protein MoaE n=1 Tax=Thermogladius sp. 4427co TaxID=3450718 RepID=UPI003F78E329